ncbi:MAG: cyclic nucleotide-binding domain-containing protein [Vampirovibrionales bacterium]|nr:cyclic nucleotide-binding domain-containing protein [Vampirovibrionales bacterium]
MTSRNYQAGEKIIAEGTYGTETYFIESGMVAIRKETGEQASKPLAELGVGDMFGEMVLLDDVGFRSASAVAMTDVTVHVVGKQQLEQDLQATPSRVRYLLDTLKKRLQATTDKLSVVQNKLAKQAAQLTLWKIYGVILSVVVVAQWLMPLVLPLLK